MDKAATIIARMGGLASHVHEAVASHLETEGVEMTRNKNGYFVDLMKLTPAQLEALDHAINRAECVVDEDALLSECGAEREEDGQQEQAPSGADASQPVDAFADVSSKTVMDKINDILKKHIPPTPPEPRKKQMQSHKRTMVITNRRTETYEPRFNELCEETAVK